MMIIYKIECIDPLVKDIYVGSTWNFNKRRIEHKSNSCNHKNLNYNNKVYQFIRLNGGFSNWDMKEIERLKCETQKDARIRELFYVRSLNAKLNHRLPFFEKDKYRQNNYKRLTQKFDCPCGGRYTYECKTHHMKTKKHISYLTTSQSELLNDEALNEIPHIESLNLISTY